MRAPDPAPEGARDPGTAGIGARGRAALTVAWCSFLAASLATMVLFALVDPAPIAAPAWPAGEPPQRTTLYSLGFLFLWATGAASAGLCAWMLAPSGRARS